MNTSTVKGDRKREIGQSPIKKKFRDATISREDIDEAIANGIKLAFKEQQSTLDSIVTSAVRAAVDSVLIPALRKLSEDIQATNNSVKELREEFEAMAAAAKQTRDRVDSVQATTREDRSAITDLRNQLERLTEKMTDMEDKSRRNNIRLVGLPEGMEGSDVAGFLRMNLSKWIPSLKGRNIEIDRAHRVYDGRKNSDRPRTLIFRVLKWHDRLEILKGARQAYPVKCTQDNVTLLFFPDFSPVTAAKRKSLVPVLRSMTALGLQPFLAYPAVIKLQHGGEQRCFILFGKRRILSDPCHRVGHLLRIHRAAGGRRLLFDRSDGRGLVTGMEEMVAGEIWMIASSISYFFFFPLSSWDSIFLFLFDTIVPLLTNPLFLSFFFSGGD